MPARSILSRAALLIATLGCVSSNALAEVQLGTGHWNTSMSRNACLQRASGILSTLGLTDVKVGKDAVVGRYGDGAVSVLCLTSNGVIVVIVSGNDASQMGQHLKAVSEKLSAN